MLDLALINEKVRGVLDQFEVVSPPVPIEKIVKGHGIIVCALPGAEEVSGAIIRRDGRAVIAINPTHHPNRQRFTLAHEFAHFILHSGDIDEHVDQDFKVNWRNAESSKAVNWEEIAANQFAAELLMPTDFLRSDLNTIGPINPNSVKLLASRYAVSRTAMEIRLTNLGLVPPNLPSF